MTTYSGQGMPEFRPYVYRGTGEDRGPRPLQARRRQRVAAALPAAARCRACGYLLRSPGHRAECGEGS